MKILINKANPAIRITAPEIGKVQDSPLFESYYTIKEGDGVEVCLSEQYWTLIEEEQKPAEWTELTWKDVNELEEIMNEVRSDYRGGGIGQKSFGLEVLERFRYIKGDELDVKEQKPAEWSEEEQTIIEGACNALEIHGHSKLADKLRTLYPQSKNETYKEKTEKPKHTEVWVEGRTIFEQDAN